MSASTGGGIYFPLGSPVATRPSALSLPVTSKKTVDPARLERPVAQLKGVGRVTARRLHDLGLETVRDLLLHMPFRHEPPSRITSVGALSIGDEVTLQVRVTSCSLRETRRRRVTVLEALVCDDTGSMVATWYNQPYLQAPFNARPEILVRGTMIRRHGIASFQVKRHEILGEAGESLHILGLVPVYPTCGELSVRTIRSLLHNAAPEARNLVDPLPAKTLARKRYPGKAEAVLSNHFPASIEEAHRARERLAYEELLLLQLAVLGRRLKQDATRTARGLGQPGKLSRGYVDSLPYEPTSAQRRVISEIECDLLRPVPMQRLLHGDVGSGKTMVAAYCMLRAVEEGGQAALMSPTEVLADQHAARLGSEFGALGVRVGLLKGSQTAGERRKVKEAIAGGEIDVVIGTHALIQEGVHFRNLRVTVVDEQHRFGVRQREAMMAAGKDGSWPHTLHMSATPIPRTLSLTLYGDLDVSVLDQMPAGRRPVRTRLVFADSEARMWEFVREQLTQGRQVYVVCPLIEESDSLEAASARQTFEQLAGDELAGFRVRLLHGQLPTSEKADVMSMFAGGEVDALVSTSVIEVGVDVANATVMVIEGARRFGLSQLHQLRGRVGRGGGESYCFLMAEGEEEAVLNRLALFARTNDGFALAEADMLARGEGQLFGERQSGYGDLEVASLLRDRRILEEARALAHEVLSGRGSGLPETARSLLLEEAERRFGSRVTWVERV